MASTSRDGPGGLLPNGAFVFAGTPNAAQNPAAPSPPLGVGMGVSSSQTKVSSNAPMPFSGPLQRAAAAGAAAALGAAAPGGVAFFPAPSSMTTSLGGGNAQQEAAQQLLAAGTPLARPAASPSSLSQNASLSAVFSTPASSQGAAAALASSTRGVTPTSLLLSASPSLSQPGVGIVGHTAPATSLRGSARRLPAVGLQTPEGFEGMMAGKLRLRLAVRRLSLDDLFPCREVSALFSSQRPFLAFAWTCVFREKPRPRRRSFGSGEFLLASPVVMSIAWNAAAAATAPATPPPAPRSPRACLCFAGRASAVASRRRISRHSQHSAPLCNETRDGGSRCCC